ncbi:phosphosulfolactate synthase [Tumebacillus algifaecis]|uniref:Phosphosulfolactate synthase n=1 Tax=Tumebacillus algifaecis TaxID=1214604 RepID=A0A223D0Z4_9BACL|nr:phosphosulfolactate synthase [Tumebacillus algifaecis]ASS75155.1 phosphosulfolactate synthase [Tumebacillus algifaecis]
MRSSFERAWDDILRDPLPGRLAKPRTTSGLTMLIDTGLGLTETYDLVELSGPYIDFVKLGFGTSKLYPVPVLRDKISFLQTHHIEVYPGGTFLEAAILQNRWQPFLERCLDLGFQTVEVSDGTIPLAPEKRSEIIRYATHQGLKVITEVGKKEDGLHLPVETQLQLIDADLQAGAFKVILEGRESGKSVGFFAEDGSIRQDDFDELTSQVQNLDQLIWEAPLKSQQQELIGAFGPNVNFGNINPRDIVALEALRVGLRSDTLRLTL